MIRCTVLESQNRLSTKMEEAIKPGRDANIGSSAQKIPLTDTWDATGIMHPKFGPINRYREGMKGHICMQYSTYRNAGKYVG